MTATDPNLEGDYDWRTTAEALQAERDELAAEKIRLQDRVARLERQVADLRLEQDRLRALLRDLVLPLG